MFSEIAIAFSFAASRSNVKAKDISSFVKSPATEIPSKPKVGFVETSSLLPPQSASTADGPRYMSKRKSMVTASNT